MGSLRKQQHVPDAGSVEQRRKVILLELLEKNVHLDRGKPQTLASPKTEGFSAQPSPLALGHDTWTLP